MDSKAYWKLIDRTRNASDGDLEAQEEALLDAVEALDPKEIIAFELHTKELLNGSFSARLWGAAYLINGGASNDGFDYFRGWLIGQGQRVYEAALANPDSLADVEGIDAGDLEFEGMWNLARQAYENKTGEPMADDVGAKPMTALSDVLATRLDFDDADAMRAAYPRLAAMFLTASA